MISLDEAIANFPALAWYSEHAEVYPGDGRNSYADCFYCKGKKTVGIWNEKKAFHCLKCDPNEGGRGGDFWNGKAYLVKMVMLVEKLSWRDAISFIYKRTGYPDPPIREKIRPKDLLPKEAIPLSKAHQDDPAIKYLRKRSMDHLIEDSYVCINGRYNGRIIIPANHLGESIGWEAKAYQGNTPPSLFPDWMDTYAYFYTSKDFDLGKGLAIITESIIDAETFSSNAIGAFGGFKGGHLPALLDLKKKGIHTLIWALDGDAWKKQAKHIVTKTLGIFKNYVCNFKQEEDPNSVGRERCWQLASEASLIESEYDLANLEIKLGRW